jgi:hypothetical protein
MVLFAVQRRWRGKGRVSYRSWALTQIAFGRNVNTAGHFFFSNRLIIKERVVRRFINQYGYIIVGVAVVVAIISIVYSMRGRTGPAAPTQAYYVDEETGAESVGDINGIPPLMGANGKPTLCKALKYTCDGGKTRTTYLLIKYPPQVQQEIASLNKDDPVQDLKRSKLIEEGYWVRKPEKGSQWYPAMSPQGQELTAVPLCPDGKPSQMVMP